CRGVPFGDLDELAGALQSDDVAAFIAEPIQAEAGVQLAPDGYFAEAAELCRRHGTLLIFDEVQTGLGRTGTRFAFEAFDVVPDVVVLAKSLGGGLAPIGATLTSGAINARAYGSKERFDLHSSTYGGNSFSCVVALETLRILDEECLAANAAVRGQAFLSSLQLRLAGHPLVSGIRGRGLLIGIALGPTARGWSGKIAP